MENTPARILIIDTAWIGDVIFSTSLIGSVVRTWNNSELHVVVAPRGAALLEGHPHVSRLWVYDKHGAQRSLASLIHLGRALAHERFDLVLCAHPSLRSRLLTALTRAPIRVGYRGFLDRFCLTHRVPHDLAVEPDHVRRRLLLLREIVPGAATAPLQVALRPDAAAWAQKFLGERAGPLLGLVIGSAWETKRWPIEAFAGLTKRWIAERGGKVLVLAGPSEAQEAAKLADVAPEAILAVNEPMSRVAALLARCTAVVGNDTGISFLAIAAGSPKVVVLYGCTQVDYTFPAPHSAIHAGVPCCLPRTGHGAHRCRWSDIPWCMEQITVERVWREITS